jgi:hypothetical protein
MKYSEFEKLSSILEEQNKSINSLVKEVTGASLPINEAETKDLDTEKTNLGGWLTNPKAAIAKKKLTNAAKKAKDSIDTKILAKFYDLMLQDNKAVMKQMLNLSGQGKPTEEIAKALQPNINVAQKATAAKLKNIEQTINKYIENTSARINSYLTKQNFNDKNKMNLDNYWLLLTSQLWQNAYSAIIQHQTDYVKKTLKDEKLQNLAMTGFNLTATEEEKAKWAKKSAENKANIEAGSKEPEENKSTEPEAQATEPEAQATEPEEKSVEPEAQATEPEEKTAEPEAQTAEPEDKAAEPEAQAEEPEAQAESKTLTQGKSYKYKTSKGNDITIEIVKANKDGSYVVKSQGKQFTLPKNSVNKVGEEVLGAPPAKQMPEKPVENKAAEPEVQEAKPVENKSTEPEAQATEPIENKPAETEATSETLTHGNEKQIGTKWTIGDKAVTIVQWLKGGFAKVKDSAGKLFKATPKQIKRMKPVKENTSVSNKPKTAASNKPKTAGQSNRAVTTNRRLGKK